ncbi:unnamed protein product [Heligmosomoides polygyrus]|uniref:Uncharacterized protein n=1 Tax=Heligmosomoides polygyrus TaxID=6339 RepID=A0A183F5Y0_HELPZ|nr:unnamed protein product [Heligmosomoides polygyrus]
MMSGAECGGGISLGTAAGHLITITKSSLSFGEKETANAGETEGSQPASGRGTSCATYPETESEIISHVRCYDMLRLPCRPSLTFPFTPRRRPTDDDDVPGAAAAAAVAAASLRRTDDDIGRTPPSCPRRRHLHSSALLGCAPEEEEETVV